jgi:hypothetical protein
MTLVKSKQLSKPISGSFTGSFSGDGSNLNGVRVSSLTGDVWRLASGSATASISPTDGFRINISTLITGSLTTSGSTFLQGTLFITGSNQQTLLLVKNSQNSPIFEIKQNGVINIATHSIDPFLISASAGDIYFTSSSFFIALD